VGAAGTSRVAGPACSSTSTSTSTRGRYDYDTQHPAIARAVIAAGPYRAGARCYGVLCRTGHYWRYLTLARLGTRPFLALSLLAQGFWAHRVAFSKAEALLAVALPACVPQIQTRREVLGPIPGMRVDTPGAEAGTQPCQEQSTTQHMPGALGGLGQGPSSACANVRGQGASAVAGAG
jgi:hypothetical protein